jgi:hypothetical protein
LFSLSFLKELRENSTYFQLGLLSGVKRKFVASNTYRISNDTETLQLSTFTNTLDKQVTSIFSNSLLNISRRIGVTIGYLMKKTQIFPLRPVA